MKKTWIVLICLVMLLSLASCGGKKDKKDGDTTVKIDGEVYYNTKKTVPVEPDESVVVRAELPLNGSTSDEKVTAYAFISEEDSGDVLVCLIDGEWYRFVKTDRAGQP